MNFDKSIIIFGGFKCATSTLQNTFNCLKSHDVFNVDLINDDINTIIIPFNDNLNKISQSAYFQDIIIPSYVYSPFNKEHGFIDSQKCTEKCNADCLQCLDKRKNIINNIEIETLIEHYKSSLKNISWNNREHLNNKLRNDLLKNKYNIHFNYSSKKIQCSDILINNKIRKIIYFHVDNINNNFNDLKYEIYNKNTPNIHLINSNEGNKKWYSNKYNNFIKLLN